MLEPGQPACMYHGEDEQEDFLVLAGECLLLIEGEERPLKAWDFVHCPKSTEHVFVGAGSGPCAVLAVGSRSGGGVVYPASELAQRHGAGVAAETHSPEEAYAGFKRDTDVAYREELASLARLLAAASSCSFDPRVAAKRHLHRVAAELARLNTRRRELPARLFRRHGRPVRPVGSQRLVHVRNCEHACVL